MEKDKVSLATLALAKAYTDEKGGGGGTSNYNDLTHKPTVNGVEFKGTMTGATLGLVNAEDGKGLSANDYTDADKSIVDGVTSALEDKISKYKTVATSPYGFSKTIGQYLTDLITPYKNLTEDEKKNARIIFNGGLYTQNSKPLPHGYQMGVFTCIATSADEVRITVFAINTSRTSIKAQTYYINSSGVTVSDISSNFVASTQDSIDMVLETTRA